MRGTLSPDSIPLEVGIPAALVLWIVWLLMLARERAAARPARRPVSGYYSLDCRDGEHSACSCCACGCHEQES